MIALNTQKLLKNSIVMPNPSVCHSKSNYVTFPDEDLGFDLDDFDSDHEIPATSKEWYIQGFA